MQIDLDGLEATARAATQGKRWRDGFINTQFVRGFAIGARPADASLTVAVVGRPEDAAFAVAADPETVLALIGRVRELETALLSARDRFYIEAAGNQCWRCFQEIPHEWEHDERFHVTDHPLAGRKRYPCTADGIWLALRHQQAAASSL